jgi:hypothetical protein
MIYHELFFASAGMAHFLGFLLSCHYLILEYMRPLCILLMALIFTACNNPGKGYISEDSLGVKRTDSSSRGDTMNYERMQQKTGAADSISSGSQRRDTGTYDRLPQQSRQRDSSH